MRISGDLSGSVKQARAAVGGHALCEPKHGRKEYDDIPTWGRKFLCTSQPNSEQDFCRCRQTPQREGDSRKGTVARSARFIRKHARDTEPSIRRGEGRGKSQDSQDADPERAELAPTAAALHA